MANNQETQSGLPQQEAGEQDTRSGAGDGQSPRTGEEGNPSENASGNAGQSETGGTGGYGGTSGASGEGQTE